MLFGWRGLGGHTARWRRVCTSPTTGSEGIKQVEHHGGCLASLCLALGLLLCRAARSCILMTLQGTVLPAVTTLLCAVILCHER